MKVTVERKVYEQPDDKNRDDKKDSGFDPEDIIKAPFEPPKVDKPKDAPAPTDGQRITLLVGFMIVLFALLLIPVFGVIGALIVAAIGAGFITIGTMVRI